MYHIDVPKLKGKMVEKGFNLGTLSNEIGVNRNTLTFYLSSPTKIPYNKITALATALCDTRDEMNTIFFAV